MAPDQNIGCQPLAADIGVEIRGEETCGGDLIKAHLHVIAWIIGDGAAEGFRRPLGRRNTV